MIELPLVFALSKEVDLDFWAGVASLLFYGLIIYMGGPTLAKALRQREQGVRAALEVADRAREEARQLRVKQQEENAKRRAEAEEMLAEAKRDADRLRTRIVEQANEEAERHRSRLDRDLRIAEAAIRIELAQSAANSLIAQAEQIVTRAMKTDDFARLFDQSLQLLPKRPGAAA